MRNESETRELILQATSDLLNEVDEVQTITIRRVAQRANVSVGLINYHFQKRSHLLRMAIGRSMVERVIRLREEQMRCDDLSIQKVRALLKNLYSFCERHERWSQFLLTHEILNGEMDAVLYLTPLLKEEFSTHKDEITLRIIAFQILLPIQVASINPNAFHHFTGIELCNVQQRENYIDTLVDNLLNNQESQK